MEEGMVVFYVEDLRVHSGRVVDVRREGEGYVFSIDSYGGCEGLYRIASDQVGRTVFFSEEDAEEEVRLEKGE